MDRPVLVVGSGTAGISACRHISSKIPERQLSLITRPSPIAPSNDYSKIVRIDYANEERMVEAQKAQEQWKKSPFAQYYIECGRIVAYQTNDQTPKTIDENRERLGLQKRQRADKEFLKRFLGLTSAPGNLVFLHNPDDAAVNWQPCILRQENEIKGICSRSGGCVQEAGVETLNHDEETVISVVLSSGEVLDTRDVDVVLAVGPWTVETLEKSQIELPPEHRIPISTGLFAFELELNQEQAEFFQNGPIFSQIGRAEFLPPVQDNRKAKVTWVEPFTISPIRDVSESALAYQTLENALEWMRTTLPYLKGAKVTTIQFYCDGVTATQAPLIARHPAIKNLFVDCGGSYTRAKDLPTNGRYIASLLRGEVIPERFSWNGSSSNSQDQPLLVARHDFDTLEVQARNYLGSRFPYIRINPDIVAII